MHMDDETVHSSAVAGDSTHFGVDAMQARTHEVQGVPDHLPSTSDWSEHVAQSSHSSSAPPGENESNEKGAQLVDSSNSALVVDENAASNGPASQEASHHDLPMNETYTESSKVDDVSDRTAHLQVSSHSDLHSASGLKREDSTATIPDTSGYNEGPSPYASTVINDDHEPPPGVEPAEDASQQEVTQLEDGPNEYQHGQHTESQAMGPPLPPPSSDATKERTPSANRLSISYAAGTRRMVIDAEVVDKLRVNRGMDHVGTNWTTNFIKRTPELKTRLSRRYDYQRA